MTNQEIAAVMRTGSALLWPNAAHQCKGLWRDGVGRTCLARMLADSLGWGIMVGDHTFDIAARAICKAAGIEPMEGVAPAHYIVAFNEGRVVYGEPIPERPFHELKALIEEAANILDGGEQPATGEPGAEEPATDAPEMPPPNAPQPVEQPAPLPTAFTNLLTAYAKEKEFA